MTARVALGLALLVALVLRGMPLLEPHLGLELASAYPQYAVLSIVERTWKPFSLVHGSLLSDVLRIPTTAWYVAGHLTGRFPARIDLLAEFLREPFPFIVTGRLVILAAALAAVWLAARTAARLGGPSAGAAAAAVLATSFIHVRSSLHVWPDALAATTAAATVLAALVHLERGGLRSALGLGGVAGLALASKPPLAPLAVPVALALWWGGGVPGRVRRAAWAAAAALVAFVVLSPYYLIDWEELLLHMRIQVAGSFSPTAAADVRLGIPTLLRVTLGVGPLVLALVGAVAAGMRDPRAAVVAAAFPVIYLALLARANPFARYFAVAAPSIAALAGVGAVAIGARLAPRRAALAAALLVAAAVAPGAVQSWDYVRLVGRDDTRILAARWLEANVAPGTAVTLPNIASYANPTVERSAGTLKLDYPRWHRELVARGLGDPARTFRLRYQGILSQYDGSFSPRDPIVVTAWHPAPSKALSTPVVNDERLRAAGYVVAARFEAVPDPPPPGLVYDPLDADYAPLVGAASVPRLGPTLTIWRAP